MAGKKVYQSQKEAQKKRSNWRYQGYPSKRNFAIFIVHCIKQGDSRAVRVRQIIDNYLKTTLTEKQQAEYLEIYRTLNETQIKYAGRFYDDDDGC